MQGGVGGKRALGACGGPSTEVWSYTTSLVDLGTDGYLCAHVQWR